VDVATLTRLLDDVYDQAVVHHGYTDYMRDYEVIVYAVADPRTGVPPAHLRYLFRHCVRASCRTAVTAEHWRESLDERLLDHEAAANLDGFVWGVRWHRLHPGAAVVDSSPTAAHWTEQVGIDFHEVRIETEAHDLTLVFSELAVTELADYTS
jgi:hypothetical protein